MFNRLCSFFNSIYINICFRQFGTCQNGIDIYIAYITLESYFVIDIKSFRIFLFKHL
jgi:hypothetical protein